MQMWCMCIHPYLYVAVQTNLNIYLSSAGHFEDWDLGLWMELNGWMELRMHSVLKIGTKLTVSMECVYRIMTRECNAGLIMWMKVRMPACVSSGWV